MRKRVSNLLARADALLEENQKLLEKIKKFLNKPLAPQSISLH